VLCGSVSLVHGDAGDPQLQQLLMQAEQQHQQQQQPLQATDEAAAAVAAAAATSTRAAGTTQATMGSHECQSIEAGSSSCGNAYTTQQQPSSRGIWRLVKEEVNAAQKRQLHSSMAGQQLGSTQLQQPSDNTSAAAAASSTPAASGSAEAGVALLGYDAASLLKGIS
jgi:hypothetical protein